MYTVNPVVEIGDVRCEANMCLFTRTLRQFSLPDEFYERYLSR